MFKWAPRRRRGRRQPEAKRFLGDDLTRKKKNDIVNVFENKKKVARKKERVKEVQKIRKMSQPTDLRQTVPRGPLPVI